MKSYFFAFISVAFLLSGCGDDVPKVADPHKPEVNGQTMTSRDFLEKYCMEKKGDETCIAVRKALVHDSARGAIPKGW
jgi:hypothetical protein